MTKEHTFTIGGVMKFNVHYGIITPESSEFGDYDETGTIAEGLTLREAIAEFYKTRTAACDGVQSIENHGPWFAIYNGQEFDTGAYEMRTLHPAGNITEASYRRVARLLGIKS